jgi:hypothetical protein
MKMISNLLVTSCLAFLAVGCASGVRYGEYRPSLAPPAPGYTRVWFYRPSLMGAIVQPAVKLDGQTVGNAVPHGFFQVETLPGTHEVSATTEWKHKTQITVSTNAESYVRLNMMMGLVVGHIIPQEVPQSQALKDLKDLRLAAPGPKEVKGERAASRPGADCSPKALAENSSGSQP